jgi:hypothetical protein
VHLTNAQVETLVNLLAEQALINGGTEYFKNLVAQANLPREFKMQRQEGWTGRADQDARSLILYADGKGVNPKDRTTTTLGAILSPELRRLGLEQAATIAALMVSARLVRDPQVLSNLKLRYQVPEPAPKVVGGGVQASASNEGTQAGPQFEWKGPDDPVELQAFFSPEPDYLDVGFLMKAITKAASVCLIEVEATGAKGTGVLIDADLILTNFHVISPTTGGDPVMAARSARCKFGVFSGAAEPVLVLQTDPDTPIVAQSPVDKLDFVLIRVKLTDTFVRMPVPFTTVPPSVKSALNLLHHPEGGEMKLSLSSNGITMVDAGTGLLQYITRATNGSSGSPCFDAEWRLVGIHHAERARPFGAIREGILIGNIYSQISSRITVSPI